MINMQLLSREQSIILGYINCQGPLFQGHIQRSYMSNMCMISTSVKVDVNRMISTNAELATPQKEESSVREK